MPVTFILGRAGAGKTRKCLEDILVGLDDPHDDRRLIFLVPEQASFQMERALALRSPRGGYWRAEVLSFSRLARRVLDETGGALPELGPAGRVMGLRCVAARLPGGLRPFGPAARTSGFFQQLDRLIEELLRENVAPQELSAAGRGLTDAALATQVLSLARVYQAYLDWLGPQRTDPAARLERLRAQLERTAWLADATVWIDGFAGFTGQELVTIVALARRARAVHVALLVDPDSPTLREPRAHHQPLNLFARTEATYRQLNRLLRESGVEVRPPLVLHSQPPPRFASCAALARLEAGLANHPVPMAAEATAPPAVRILECSSHREELRQAAHEIRRQVLESGGRVRFRDFALITRDLEPFGELAAEVFDEYEIPYFLDRRRPLRAHALSRFMRSLLEAAGDDLPGPAMRRLLQSGLLPLGREAAERLDALIERFELRGLEVWSLPRWEFAGGWLREDAATAAGRLRIARPLGRIIALAAAGSATGATWANAIYATLDELTVPPRIAEWIDTARSRRDYESAELHRQAWDHLVELLDELHELLAETRLTLSELAALLTPALADATVGIAPPTLDQVLISAIERSRHPDIRHAWIFAFNEGVFPQSPARGSLLSESARAALSQAGLPAPAPLRDDVFTERLLAYIAMTRPSQSLTISYALRSESGETMHPSPLLRDVQRLLPELPVEQPDGSAPPVCLDEAARGYIRHVLTRPSELCTRYQQLCGSLEGTDAGRRLTWLLRGREYRNAPPPIGNFRAAGPPALDTPHLPSGNTSGGVHAGSPRAARQGPAEVVWDTSPSELDSYLLCPFQHFARYGLRLDTQRGPTPLAIELGRAAHDILAAVTRRAMQQEQPLAQLSDADWLALLEDCVQDRLGAAGAGPARPQREFLAARLRELLRDVVLVHAHRWRRGRFVPLAVEQPFGEGPGPESWPALELTLDDARRVRIHGRIDRVDVWRTGRDAYLLVYDYKTRPPGAALRKPYLVGDPLQLLAYLLAAVRAHPREANALPAGVLIAPHHPDSSALENAYVAEAPPDEQRMYLYRPRGLVHEAVAVALDAQRGNSPHSPVASMQRRRDGGYYENSDVAGAGELRARLTAAEQTIRCAAEGIAAGRVDVAPLLQDHDLACSQCDFQRLCRFETVHNRVRRADRALPQVPAPGTTP